MNINISKLLADMVAKGQNIPKSLRHYFPKPTKQGRAYGTGCYPRNPKQIAQMNAMHERLHGKA